MLTRSSVSGALLSVLVAVTGVACAAPMEDVGEDGASALSQGGTRALASLSKVVNGDATALAEYGEPATMASASVGSWSVLTRLGEAGRIEGYLFVSASKRVAFLVDFDDSRVDDGLVAEIAGVQLAGGEEDLVRLQRELVADLEGAFTTFGDEMPEPAATVGTSSLVGGLAPKGGVTVALSVLEAIVKMLPKAAAKEASVVVRAAAAGGETSAAKLVEGASKGEHVAVSGAVKTNAKAWPSLFETGGPLRRALQGNTLVTGDDVVKAVRAKAPAQTIAIDVGSSGGVAGDAGNIAKRMQTYLTDLIAKQKAQGKISTLTDVKEINMLDVSTITTEPLEVGRTFARNTGASHVFLETEAVLAQRSAQAVVDKPFSPFKERAGGYFYYLGRMAGERIAAVGESVRAGNLWGSGQVASGSLPGNLAADHASIIFMRKDPGIFGQGPQAFVDRVVRLISAGKRVVIIDGGEAAGNGALGTLLRNPRFQALSEADRALLDAI
jgi:hypothetical protein